MKRIRFGKKNIVKLSGAVIVVLVLLSVYFRIMYVNSKENLVASCKKQVIQDGESINNYFAESVNSIKLASYEIGSMLEENADNDKIREYLEHQTRLYENAVDESYEGLYGVFGGVYMDGIGWEPEPGYVPEDRPWYTAAVDAAGDVAMVNPYLDSMTNTVKISISRILPDNKSVVALDMGLGSIQNIVEEYAGCNNWRYVMILDSDGYVMAHSDSDELGKNYIKDGDSDGNNIVAGLEESDGYYEVRYKDKSYMAFTGTIVGNWHIVSLMEREKLLGSLKLLIIMFVITLLAIFGVIIWVILKLQYRQMQMTELNRQIKAVSGIYASMHLFNIKNDTYYEVSNSVEEVRSMLGNGNDNAQYLVRKIMDMMTDERFKKGMYDFIEFSTMADRLKGKKTITKEFINYKNYRCKGRFVPVDWDENGELETVMWMVEVTDERID